mmetsp:Transcript_132705/g.424719  ORF Transcript_132705/g.424719 Transcript_132705/m.424719 type:complete len:210 (-) Transcript_132705:1006-1635(-)
MASKDGGANEKTQAVFSLRLTSHPTSHHLESAKAIDVLIVESFSPEGETQASRIQKWSRMRMACEFQRRQCPTDVSPTLRPEFVRATDGLLGHGQEDPSGFLGRICSRTSRIVGSAHALTRHLCHGPNPDGQLCRRKLANLFEVHITKDRGTQRGHLLDVEPNACNCPQTADEFHRGKLVEAMLSTEFGPTALRECAHEANGHEPQLSD